MTWFDTFTDDEQQSVEQLQKQGITGKPAKKKDVGLFDGVDLIGAATRKVYSKCFFRRTDVGGPTLFAGRKFYLSPCRR